MMVFKNGVNMTKKIFALVVILLATMDIYSMNKSDKDYDLSDSKFNEEDELSIEKIIKKHIDDLVEEHASNDDERWIPILFDCARYEECYDHLEFLLKRGINPNLKDFAGYAPLYSMCKEWKPVLKNLSLLLKHDANPNISDRFGETPLMVAVERNPLDIITLLLENEANPNLKDDSGDTSLMHAVRKTCFNEPRANDETLRKNIVLALLKAGADTTLENNKGQTAIDIASARYGFNDLADVIENYKSS